MNEVTVLCETENDTTVDVIVFVVVRGTGTAVTVVTGPVTVTINTLLTVERAVAVDTLLIVRVVKEKILEVIVDVLMIVDV